MSVRNRNPDPHPFAEVLRDPDTDRSEDVISIVGFVAPREPEGPLVLFADEDCQQYMVIPFEDFVHSEPLRDDERGRTRIFVRRGVMTDDLFELEALDGLAQTIRGPAMSVWQFLPQNRLVAAAMLGMLSEEQRRLVYEEEA